MNFDFIFTWTAHHKAVMLKTKGISKCFSSSVARNKLQTEDPQNQPRLSQTIHQSGYGPLGHHQLQRGSEVSVCESVSNSVLELAKTTHLPSRKNEFVANTALDQFMRGR